MSEITPSKRDIVSLVEAQAKSIDSISERLVKIENLVDKQDSKNQNVITGVVIAFILIVGTVAIEVILSNKADHRFYSSLEKDTYEQNLKVQDLNNKVDNIKIRNPYLK
ncbi:MAG: hypothetical protein AAB773_01350 [Patescibacteria group bacterium]